MRRALLCRRQEVLLASQLRTERLARSRLDAKRCMKSWRGHRSPPPGLYPRGRSQQISRKAPVLENAGSIPSYSFAGLVPSVSAYSRRRCELYHSTSKSARLAESARGSPPGAAGRLKKPKRICFLRGRRSGESRLHATGAGMCFAGWPGCTADSPACCSSQ